LSVEPEKEQKIYQTAQNRPLARMCLQVTESTCYRTLAWINMQTGEIGKSKQNAFEHSYFLKKNLRDGLRFSYTRIIIQSSHPI
jgi:hypothetical protein